jgi:hypothetical protein
MQLPLLFQLDLDDVAGHFLCKLSNGFEPTLQDEFHLELPGNRSHSEFRVRSVANTPQATEAG